MSIKELITALTQYTLTPKWVFNPYRHPKQEQNLYLYLQMMSETSPDVLLVGEAWGISQAYQTRNGTRTAVSGCSIEIIFY